MPGEEKSHLFAMLFLRRLPAAVRLQLTEDDHQDVRALADKADRCAASLHRQQPVHIQAVLPSADEPDPGAASINAVNIGGRGAQRGGSCGRNNRGGRGRNSGGRRDGRQLTPSKLAQQGSGLCPLHDKYGEEAHSCSGNCSWQGN